MFQNSDQIKNTLKTPLNIPVYNFLHKETAHSNYFENKSIIQLLKTFEHNMTSYYILILLRRTVATLS